MLCLLAASASAQPRRAPKPARLTISAGGGVQTSAGGLSDHFSFAKNLETETIDVTYPMKAWALFDVGAAYSVWKNVAVGVAVSRVSGTGTADVTASVPHPFFFNQPRTVTGTENGIVHAETAVHPELQFLIAASRRVRAVLSTGPTWITLEHEVVRDITISESYPYDTAAFGGAVTKLTKASVPGYHAGLDVAWMFTGNAGIGGLVRYTRADVDLDVSEGRTLRMKAGGVQGTVGVRLRF
jgi:hypothetical protein